MTGKVFISCGQRPPDETAATDALTQLLREEFGLNPYVATRVQSLGDIMAIVNELRSSDYYLFIDFVRTGAPTDLPCSLFTHQELALAHHRGFLDRVIALQQQGAQLEGFLKYIQANPESFTTRQDLINTVRRLVRARGWTAAYSRNLIVSEIRQSPLYSYTDHTGTTVQIVWQAKIENRRPDAAAVGAVCILDSIRAADGSTIPCEDRAYLKWAGQLGYERTLLPNDYGVVDLFAIRPDVQGLFLLSLRDTPREPVVRANGNYDLQFKVFARDFPLLEFAAQVSLRWQAPAPPTWTNETTAALKA